MTSPRSKPFLYTSIFILLWCSTRTQNHGITQISNRKYIHCVSEENTESVMYTSPPLNIWQRADNLLHNKLWKNDDWIIKCSNETTRTIVTDKRWEEFNVVKADSLRFNPIPPSLSVSAYGANKTHIFGDELLSEHIEESLENMEEWTTFSFFSRNGLTHYYKNGTFKKLFPTPSRFVVSTLETAYFKVHQYEYREANVTSTKGCSTTLTVPKTENVTYLMVYVSLCKSCLLEIQVNNGQKQYVYSSVAEKDQLQQWQSYKINISSSESNAVKFTRIQNKPIQSGYWKLDLRLHNTENNIVTYARNSSKKTYNCKYFQIPKNLKKDLNKHTWINCKPGQLGTKCDISCKKIFGQGYEYCEKHKIWFNPNFYKCAWGYTGDWCDQECKYGLWGLSCEEECESKCPLLCHKSNGKCLINSGFSNIAPRTSNETTKAYFTLSKNDFTYATEEIIAYALILFNEHPELNNTYGFWNGTTITWPFPPNNSHQITPPNWNPFKDEVHTCNFIIGGDSSCCGKYCVNDPLKPNTKYWLLIRVFTRTTYNDSTLFFFQTGSTTSETNMETGVASSSKTTYFSDSKNSTLSTTPSLDGGKTTMKTGLETSITSKPNAVINFVNLSPVISNDTTKAYFTLSKNHLIDSTEEIIAYSLILLETPIDLNITSGFWDGTIKSWPPPPKYSVQLTPSYWNPFQDEDEICTFIIGAENKCCRRYCKDNPLKPNTEYWLMVRALTRTAYNSSSLLYFQTASTTEESSFIKFLLIILLGVNVTVAIVLYVICVVERRN